MPERFKMVVPCKALYTFSALSQSQAYFSIRLDFMMGFEKPKLCTKFEFDFFTKKTHFTMEHFKFWGLGCNVKIVRPKYQKHTLMLNLVVPVMVF